jgi:membrane-associated phospholipid phosphatase
MPKGNKVSSRFHEITHRRLCWLAIILVAILLYFPINRFMHDGVQLALPIDQNIPLYPPAIVPYLLGAALIVLFPIWAAIYIKPKEFEAYVVSILTATVISYLAYLIFPTFVSRPEIVSNDVFSKIIAILYQADRAYNAAPSGHTFYTLISCLYLSRWQPRYKLVWAVLAVLIILSTLFTRQHYVLDLVCGLALAVLAYVAGRFAQKRWNLQFAS